MDESETVHCTAICLGLDQLDLVVDLRNFNRFIRWKHRVRIGIILQDSAIREVFAAAQYVLVMHDWKKNIRQVNDECRNDNTDYKATYGLSLTFINRRWCLFFIFRLVCSLLLM